MGGHKIINQSGCHFVTFTVVGWVDLFSRRRMKDIIASSLNYCLRNKGLEVIAYVIMSNHIHLILKSICENDLSSIIRDFKKHTSKEIFSELRKNGVDNRSSWMLALFEMAAVHNSRNIHFQVWMQNNHPIEIQSYKWFSQKLAYIHLNPVRAGLVDYAEHYVYSSARNYLGQDSPVDVDCVDLILFQ